MEQKYTRRLKRELKKHQLQERQLNLEHAIAHNPPGSTLTEAQAIEANAIDHLAEIAMKTAERHCRRIRAGLVEYSKAIAGPISRIKFWQYAIRRRQGKHCSSKHWKRLKNQAEVKIPTRHMSIQDMEQELKQARIEYGAAKKVHHDARRDYLQTFSEKERNRLLRVEEQ